MRGMLIHFKSIISQESKDLAPQYIDKGHKIIKGDKGKCNDDGYKYGVYDVYGYMKKGGCLEGGSFLIL